MLKQKSRNLWLNEAGNSTHFFTSIMWKSAQNRIIYLLLDYGIIITDEGVRILGNSRHICILYERYASLFHEDVNALITLPGFKRADIL